MKFTLAELASSCLSVAWDRDSNTSEGHVKHMSSFCVVSYCGANYIKMHNTSTNQKNE
jgi:hypothetical protein